jgi:hypothetical protein
MGLAANLTQVARLRAEIAAAKACEGECWKELMEQKV